MACSSRSRLLAHSEHSCAVDSAAYRSAVNIGRATRTHSRRHPVEQPSGHRVLGGRLAAKLFYAEVRTDLRHGVRAVISCSDRSCASRARSDAAEASANTASDIRFGRVELVELRPRGRDPVLRLLERDRGDGRRCAPLRPPRPARSAARSTRSQPARRPPPSSSDEHLQDPGLQGVLVADDRVELVGAARSARRRTTATCARSPRRWRTPRWRPGGAGSSITEPITDSNSACPAKSRGRAATRTACSTFPTGTPSCDVELDVQRRRRRGTRRRRGRPTRRRQPAGGCDRSAPTSSGAALTTSRAGSPRCRHR